MRNSIAQAMNSRPRGTIMHDRREERGGAYNEQEEYLEEYEDYEEDEG